MIKNLESRFWNYLHYVSPHMNEFLWKRRLVLKYIIGGGTAATTNLLLLYFFTDIVGLWYIVSAVLAFSVAFVVSFCFQKFWTFEDHSTDNVHMQATAYLLVALTNLCLNTALIYFFVEFLSIHYLIAQIISGIAIACESFFIYRLFIFKNTRSD